MPKHSTETKEENKSTQDKKKVVHFKADDLHLSLNTANDVKKQRRWPFGPGHPLEGWGDGLTEVQAEQVALRLRNGSVKQYNKELTEIEKERMREQGLSFQDVYAKKYGDKIIAEVVQEGIDGKPLQPKEQHLNMEDARKYLTSVEKDAPGNAMLPQLKGAFDGKSEQSYRILNNGVAIVRYNNLREFNRDIAVVGSQRDIDDDLTSITNTKFRTLVSAVEIAPQNEQPSYRIVVSDGKGVRVNTIKQEEFEKLITHNKDLTKTKDLTDQQKLENRKKFIDQILEDYTPLRTPLSHLKGARDELLSQTKNDKLFGFIPLRGLWGGRKDKLKRAIKSANFTFSEKDGVVVDQNKFRPYRKTITINGDTQEDTYVDLGHDCAVKVNASGKIEEDSIYKLEKDGSRSKIDISGDMFRMPLSVAGPLTSALRKPLSKIGKFLDSLNLNFFSSDHSAARKKAREVMKAYKKLEIIVCKNPDNSNSVDDQDGEKKVGLSFMVDGKTHGLHFSQKERIFNTVTAAGLAVGASIGSAGAATAIGAGVAGAFAAATGLSSFAGVKNSMDHQSDLVEKEVVKTRKVNVTNIRGMESSR